MSEPARIETWEPGAPPRLVFAFEVEVELSDRLHFGPLADSTRRGFVGVRGGVVRGPRFSGRVVPNSGGDYPAILADGTAIFDARYLLEAEDGTVVQLNSRGYRTGPPEVLQRIVAGEQVDPSEYYAYLTPRFDAPEGQHGWLGRTVFLVTSHRHPSAALFRYWMAE